MSGALSVKDEIIEIIEKMPERKLYALRDFLLYDDNEDEMVSDDELALFFECERDRKERPESFVNWRDVRREA